MRVMIDTTYPRRAPYSGTAIYVERVADALARLDGVEVETVYNPRRGRAAGGGIGSVRNLLTDRWWTGLELPRLAKRARVDVVHHPLPAIAGRSSVPQAITVHDLAFERLPDHFDHAFRIHAHRAHRAAALAAGAVICVSETTARDVRSLWGVPIGRIVVARHGPGQKIGALARRDPGQQLAASAPPAEHFLYVGDDEPRKNVRVMLAAYAAYRQAAERPLDLLLAGSAKREGPGIKVEHQPSPERLSELYAAAAALIQPSLYEGFGLTALEAMSVGTPVLAADIPGLREVCGEAAAYASPHDPRAFAAWMARIASRPALREQLSERGRSQASQFSWEACAHAHVGAYELAGRAAPKTPTL
jgi:glycosyltransferase involved in cell wall biosynthesis